MKINRQLLYNPFTYLAGFKSLIIGLIILIIISLLAYTTGTHYIGYININFAKDSPFWIYLVENAIHGISVSLVFYIAVLMLSKSRIRMVDIVGTILTSKIPLLIVPVIRLFHPFDSFSIFSAPMYLLIVIYLISIIWSVTLMFNAFRISCNLKQDKLILSFIIGLVISDAITQKPIYFLSS